MYFIITIISFYLMLSQKESSTIIIDNGTRTCKVGFAGDQLPNILINSFVGTDSETNDIYVSNDAYSRADLLSLNYPIDHRIIKNWDDMQKIWHYIFHNKLHVDPTSHPVLLTDDPLNTKENREKMTQIMFETFDVPSLYIAKRPVLSLYSSGRLNGIVVDSGDSSSLATPIFDGYYIQNAAVPLKIAGNDVTMTLQKLLNKRGYNFSSFSQQEIIRNIKEKHCYLSSDYDSEIKKDEVILNYTLPDGKVIRIGNELFSCCEILFNTNGIVDIFFESLKRCDEKIRNDLCKNIVISGGTTKLNNFYERFKTEINKRAPSGINFSVIKPHRRQYAAWIGGSTLASLTSFKDMMINSDEYKESGSSIIRKCP